MRLNSKVIVFIGVVYVMGSHLSFVCIHAHMYLYVCMDCYIRKRWKHRLEVNGLSRRVLLYYSPSILCKDLQYVGEIESTKDRPNVTYIDWCYVGLWNKRSSIDWHSIKSILLEKWWYWQESNGVKKLRG